MKYVDMVRSYSELTGSTRSESVNSEQPDNLQVVLYVGRAQEVKIFTVDGSAPHLPPIAGWAPRERFFGYFLSASKKGVALAPGSRD